MRLLDGFAGQEVRRGERLRQGRDRLHRAADDERLAVRHAAGQPARVVRPVDPAAALAAPLDDVVDRRPEPARLLEPEAEFDAFDDVDAHDRGRKLGVQPPVPLDVRAQANREAVGDDLEHATDRVAVRPRLVDPGDHRGLRLGIRAAERGGIGVVARQRRPRRVHGHAADFRGERPDLDAELAKERPRDPAGRDPCRGLPRRCSLEDVADVAEAVLQRPGQVGVAGPDARHGRRALVAVGGGGCELGGLLVAERLDLHHPRPVLPVAIGDHQEDRRAERRPVADARDDLGPVVLDRLARPATVAALAPGEIDREHVGRQREPGRDAVERDPERGPVQFAGGQEAEAAHDVGPQISRRRRPRSARPPPPRRQSPPDPRLPPRRLFRPARPSHRPRRARPPQSECPRRVPP